MNGEAGILQNRIQILPLDRCGDEADKGIGGEENERKKGSTHQALHGDGIRPQPRRQRAAHHGDQRTEQRQDQRPQQH